MDAIGPTPGLEGRLPPRGVAAFVLTTVLIDVLAMSLVAPVLPLVVRSLVGGDVSRAAHAMSSLGVVWAAMQFVASPLVGALSDRFGRRPVLLVSMLGLGVDLALMAWAPTLAWLLFGRAISGITAATYSTAIACMADVTPPARRAANFGLVGAASGIALILGPALGGVLGEVDLRLPFWAGAALALANATFGWYALPESLPVARRSRRFDWRAASPFGFLAILRGRPLLSRLMAVQALYTVTQYAIPTVFVLYVTGRFGWSSGKTGAVLTLLGCAAAVVQGAIVMALIRRLGEARVMLIGLAAGAAGYLAFATATSTAGLLLGVPFVAMLGLSSAASQALMSSQVPAEEQGRLQSVVNGSLFGIAGLVAPPMFAWSFAAASLSPGGSVVAGAPFHLAGAALAAGFLLAWRLRSCFSEHALQ